ncbi:conserved phage C-terminal domain-containing protein [Romboutsia sp. MSSM.1001216sp_RTP31141st1_G3_RTP31141_220114]|uniref:conserved phage C-terminal domain-containing protein n=1 Tax=unclassified Romboutsia TaxID=2626894 RepID=UPI0031B64394
MKENFYPFDNEILKYSLDGVETIDFKKYPDLLKILFSHWFSQKENYTRIKKQYRKGEFELSIREVQNKFGITRYQAEKLIKLFVKNDLIEPINKGNSDSNKSIYFNCIFSDSVSDRKQTVKQTHKYSNSNNSDTTNQTVKQTVFQTVNLNYKKDNIKKNNKKEIYSRVITRLNELTGKSYKPTTKKTIACIDARLNEGFKEDDLYKVIDIKTKEWLGTEYEKYLRPETLFGSKFEGYLNQKLKEPQNNSLEEFKGLKLV